MAEFERLTHRLENGDMGVKCEDYECVSIFCGTDDCPANKAVVERLAAYEDTGYSPDEINKAASIQRWEDSYKEDYERKCKELLAYTDSGLTPERVTKLGKAEAEGKLFLLPCKVGDTVFRICGSRGRKFVAEREVVSITICSDNDIRLFTTTEDWLGRTVFSTREEAQAALERMKRDAK